jgi:hypothetical protein
VGCNIKDEDIKAMTDQKDKLKDLMSGGASKLGDMETAKAKMQEGLDLINGKATGPVELGWCTGFDEDLVLTDDDFNPITPTSKAACLNANGQWNTKTIENFSLQEEVAKLGALGSSPTAFTQKITEIQEKFGDKVDDLAGKLNKLNTKIGEAISEIELPKPPSIGDTVQQCVCVGGDALATDQASCEESGGVWECKEVTLTTDPLNVGEAINGGIGKLSSSFTPDDPAKFLEGNEDKVKSIFGGNLPQFSEKTVCDSIPDIKVKDKLVKDPITGKMDITKLAETLPKPSVVPKEKPKVSPPAPPVKNELSAEESKAIGTLTSAVGKAFDSLYRGSKQEAGEAKGFDKLVKDYRDAHKYWFLNELAKAVGGDANRIYSVIPEKVNIIYPGEAEQAARAWFKFLDGRELKREDFDKTLKPMMFNYTKAEYAKLVAKGESTKTWDEALQIQYDKWLGEANATRAANFDAAPAEFSDALKEFNMGGGFSNIKLPF